jgi:hypothetical protein
MNTVSLSPFLKLPKYIWHRIASPELKAKVWKARLRLDWRRIPMGINYVLHNNDTFITGSTGLK